MDMPFRRRDVDAAKIRELYEQGAKATEAEATAYWLNHAYMGGEQWIWWSEQHGRLEEIAPPPDRVRLTINKLRPASRTIMSKLLRRPLTFDVPPTAADDKAIGGARLAASVLRDRHREQDWESIREDLAWVTWEGGTGLLAVEWDPSAGIDIGETPNGKPMGTGEVTITALSVVEAVTQRGSRDIERGTWWIKALALPCDEVRHMYRLPNTPKADASAVMTPLQRKLTAKDKGDATSGLTLVLTYYERPNRDNPKGAVKVVIGDRVVDQGPWPFPFKDRLNLAVARETPIHGQWTGQTVVSDAVLVQTAFNLAHSAIEESVKHHGFAKLMAAAGSLDESDLTDHPADVLEYQAVSQTDGKPEYLVPPSLPSWIIDHPEVLKRELDDILGHHDVSRGQAPSDASGIAITLLVEQDDTPIGRMAKALAEAWGKAASMALQTYAAKVTESRKALTLDGEGPEQHTWTGVMLAGQTRAVVPLDAVSPRSRAASFQLASQLRTSFPDDVDFRTFARIADLPGQEDLMQGVDPDVALARYENWMMGIGRVPIPEPLDDHAKHIAEINRFRKTPAYRAMTPEQQDVYIKHAQGHANFAAEEQGRQVAKAAVHPLLAAAADADEPAQLDIPVAAAIQDDAQNEAGNATSQVPSTADTPQQPAA